MVEGPALKALWLLLAYGCSLSGLAWLALAMEPHWQQVRAGPPPAPGALRSLRMLGVGGLLLSLWACLRADHVLMAALVWLMLLAAAALTVAFTLSWQPRWLAPLVCWVQPTPRPPGGTRAR